ncbi:Aste57867_1747 [Aphanomyces stellatus]|uniref:Aste57867_1747 protein n=1 Tax=Aphanomyces stellatus TaxID=120398 RepID=A0A485KB37_9STRA|nr:hypothetical protein As57867_001745 [Aphanomyces stellatus]VFT78957.1 Aste57867_1747 [Aphanomyces stellatus]
MARMSMPYEDYVTSPRGSGPPPKPGGRLESRRHSISEKPGGGLFGFFKKKESSDAPNEPRGSFSLFGKNNEPYFPPISPESLAIHAHRRPMDFPQSDRGSSPFQSDRSMERPFPQHGHAPPGNPLSHSQPSTSDPRRTPPPVEVGFPPQGRVPAAQKPGGLDAYLAKYSKPTTVAAMPPQVTRPTSIPTDDGSADVGGTSRQERSSSIGKKNVPPSWASSQDSVLSGRPPPAVNDRAAAPSPRRRSKDSNGSGTQDAPPRVKLNAFLEKYGMKADGPVGVGRTSSQATEPTPRGFNRQRQGSEDDEVQQFVAGREPTAQTWAKASERYEPPPLQAVQGGQANRLANVSRTEPTVDRPASIDTMPTSMEVEFFRKKHAALVHQVEVIETTTETFPPQIPTRHTYTPPPLVGSPANRDFASVTQPSNQNGLFRQQPSIPQPRPTTGHPPTSMETKKHAALVHQVEVIETTTETFPPQIPTRHTYTPPPLVGSPANRDFASVTQPSNQNGLFRQQPSIPQPRPTTVHPPTSMETELDYFRKKHALLAHQVEHLESGVRSPKHDMRPSYGPDTQRNRNVHDDECRGSMTSKQPPPVAPPQPQSSIRSPTSKSTPSQALYHGDTRPNDDINAADQRAKQPLYLPPQESDVRRNSFEVKKQTQPKVMFARAQSMANPSTLLPPGALVNGVYDIDSEGDDSSEDKTQEKPAQRFAYQPEGDSDDDDDDGGFDNTTYAVKSFKHKNAIEPPLASPKVEEEEVHGVHPALLDEFYNNKPFEGHSGHEDPDEDEEGGDYPSTAAAIGDFERGIQAKSSAMDVIREQEESVTLSVEHLQALDLQSLGERPLFGSAAPSMAPHLNARSVVNSLSSAPIMASQERLVSSSQASNFRPIPALDRSFGGQLEPRFDNSSPAAQPLALFEGTHHREPLSSVQSNIPGPESAFGGIHTPTARSTLAQSDDVEQQVHQHVLGLLASPGQKTPTGDRATGNTTPQSRQYEAQQEHPAAEPLLNQTEFSDSSASSDDDHDSMGSPAASVILDTVYATQQGRSKRKPTKKQWYPVPDLVATPQSHELLANMGAILKRVCSQKKMSKETLEIRAAMPEYRLEKADWMLAKKAKQDDLTTIPCVARLPMDLLITGTSEDQSGRGHKKQSHEGFLLKQGQVNVTMQRRYMILQDNELVYYKQNPELNHGWFGKEKPRGSLHMGNITLVRPYLNTLTLELVTTKRTWVLQAETERDYKAWARALCNCVPYHAVDIVFKRMFGLTEVDASDRNQVRLRTLPHSTVAETVEHIFINYVQMAGAAPLKPFDPADYFLKVTGFRDYLIHPTSKVSQYSHIQECLFSKKTLCLSVLHRDAIDASIRDAAIADMRLDTLPTHPRQPHPALDHAVGSGLFQKPLQFSIQQIRNSPVGHNTHVVVTAELYYNGDRLEKIGDTSEVALAGGGGDWVRPRPLLSAFQVSALPRETRLVLTVFGFQTSEKWTPLFSTGLHIFDEDGLLVHGDMKLPLLDAAFPCHTGPVPQIVFPGAPYLIISLSRPNVAIRFDWSMHKGRVPDVDVSLDRSGWLSERPTSSLSAGAWAEKWCRLSHASCSLSMAPDAKSGITHSLPLDGASVAPLDAMNQRQTTKLTSSTRREQQTWAFQLRLHGNPRPIVMAARTRHERDAWVKTLALVAARRTFWDDDDDDNASDDVVGRASFLGQFVKPVGVSRSLGDFGYLVQLVQENPLYKLSGFEKAMLWRHRRAFVGSFEALPRVLSSLNWLDPVAVDDMLALLPAWTTPRHPAAYLALLEFAHVGVREFVVDQLRPMTDTTIRQFLPQLVQAIKGELFHTSPLADFVIERALKTPNQIGFDLFWALRVETYSPQYHERFGLLLNALLDVVSPLTRGTLQLQDKLFSEGGMFSQLCQQVKRLGGYAEATAALPGLLEQLNHRLPRVTFQLPIDPRVEVRRLVVDRCRIMSSAKLPLWLEFENAETGAPVAIIFKSGDDLRQDALALQLIRVMDDLWREDAKDLAMEPYKCVATGPSTGVVQVVPQSNTTAEIQRRGNGILGAFNDASFLHWLQEHNTQPRAQRAAVDLFLRSCAGYCVATYVLGIGDRHNDNMMMARDGRFFHIDFGHFLGFFKYVPLLGITIKRERTPFVFTPQMAHVFGGEHAPGFVKFIKTSGDAFNVVRRHFHVLVTLLQLMVPAHLPELRDRDDVNYVVETIAPDLSDTDAFLLFEDLVRQCHACKWKQYDNAAHLAYHKS